MAWLEIEGSTLAGTGTAIHCEQGAVLTPSGGAITVTDGFHVVAEGTLGTINGGIPSSRYVLLTSGTLTITGKTNLVTTATTVASGKILPLWFDGTNYTDERGTDPTTLSASDLTNGVTGSGAIVLAASPTLSGNVGIGGAASYPLYVNGKSWLKGITNIGATQPSVNVDDEILCRIGSGNTALVDVNGNTHADDAIGLSLCANTRAVNNIARLTELQVDPVFGDDSSSRTVAQGAAIAVSAYGSYGTLTITDMYGLLVANPTIGTNRYAARFNGKVGINIAPTADLHVSGTLTVTGVPTIPTAAVDTNTTQAASTAFVLAQKGTATPIVDGTGAAGTSNRWTPIDHVHPTDTSRAPLASPTFTGTVTLPATNESGGLNVTDGNVQIKSQRLQAWTLWITNSAGTIQHKITSSTSSSTAGNFNGQISGASSSFANTPFVTAAVNFTNGFGVDNASKSDLYFNVAAQTIADCIASAELAYYDGNVTTPLPNTRILSLNINGTTRNWFACSLGNPLTGAAWTVDTTNIPAGKLLGIRFFVFIA